MDAGLIIDPTWRVTQSPIKLRVCDLEKRYSAVAALTATSLDMPEGEFLTLLGPSGSGKTTLLMLIAGLIQPDAGDIWIDGRLATYMPPNKRDIGLVFQNYALFPHLSIFENVAFPLRMRRVPEAKIRRKVEQALETVRLPHVTERLPQQLSGGQQQRVALARCIVYEPSLILMDEPLGALDKKLRDQMQFEIKQLCSGLGISVLYVTHDQEEAMVMSDRICLMNQGRIEQIGKADELYFAPRTVFAADFLGESNLLDVEVLESGTPMVVAGPAAARIPLASVDGCQRGERIKMMLRPESIAILEAGQAADVTLDATIESATVMGGTTRIFLVLKDGTRLKAAQLTGLGGTKRRRPPRVTARPNATGGLRRWSSILPLAPAIILLSILFYYPVLQLLSLSVVDPHGAFTALHYEKLFASPVYVRVLMITLRIAGWTTLLTIVAAYPVAYLLSNVSGRTRNLLLLCILMPYWTGYLVRTFAWMVLLGRNGLLNALLTTLGLVDAPVTLIYSFTGVMIGTVNAVVPLAAVTMMSVMGRIDANLPRAARTLGARSGQAFWRVYFPLSLPGVAAAGLLVFITTLGFFITPALLGSGRQTMIAQLIFDQVQQLLNWGFAGAIAVLLLATALAIFALYDRLFGLSTLSGGNAAAAIREPGLLARLGARAGTMLIAAMGWLCDRIEIAAERIRPARAQRRSRSRGRAMLWAAAVAVIIFLIAPSLFIIPVSFTKGAFIEWPPQGLSLKWYAEVLESDLWTSAALRSLIVAVLTASLALVIGTPAAFALTRGTFRGKTFWLSLLLSPLIIPSILTAVALYYFYSRLGLIGTSLGLVLGHTVVTIPYVVITVSAILKTYDIRLDQAALTLGASQVAVFRRVTFPLIRGGLLAAFLIAFITSFEELTIALFVTGGLANTLPRQLWSDALMAVSPALAVVSTIILVVVTAVIFTFDWLARPSPR